MTEATVVHGDERRDVVIVGAGVAGVSCALECVDIQLDTAVFEAQGRPGGQVVEIPHAVRNVATGPPRDGSTLRDSLEDSAVILGDRLRLSHPVTGADLAERWIEVDGARIRARALVIATGTSHQQLPAAPDGAFGGDVTYLLEARPDRFVGRDVVVIGGGDSGTLDALELRARRIDGDVGPSFRGTHGTSRHRRAGSPGAPHRGTRRVGAGVPGGRRPPRGRDARSSRRRAASALGGGRRRREDRARASDGSLSRSTGAGPSGRRRRRRGLADVARRRVRGGRRRLGCVRPHRSGDGSRLARRTVGASVPPRPTVTTASPTNVPAVADVVAALRHAPGASARPAPKGVMGLLLGLHQNNALQWDREDAARRDDADDHAVADAKRDIDVLNAKRHDFVEAIDGALDAVIDQSSSAPPTTESPGMVFDRLSVLVLRIASTEDAARGEPVDHELYTARLPVLHAAACVPAGGVGGALRRRAGRPQAVRAVSGLQAVRGTRIA